MTTHIGLLFQQQGKLLGTIFSHDHVFKNVNEYGVILVHLRVPSMEFQILLVKNNWIFSDIMYYTVLKVMTLCAVCLNLFIFTFWLVHKIALVPVQLILFCYLTLNETCFNMKCSPCNIIIPFRSCFIKDHKFTS
jgi:hypothetical protein